MRAGSLLPALAAVLIVLAGCGKELGRVPFAAEGTQTATAELAAGDVAFWTDIDIELEGNAGLAYTVQLSQGGAPVATATCNPLGKLPAKIGWVETTIGSKHKRKGSGKMECAASVPKSGPTAVSATLAFSQRPTSVTLRKADLVIKQ